MGLWARISGSFEDPDDKYSRSAEETLERVHKYVRKKYGDDREIFRPKEAEELKFHIRCVNEQGGWDMHKYALGPVADLQGSISRVDNGCRSVRVHFRVLEERRPVGLAEACGSLQEAWNPM